MYLSTDGRELDGLGYAIADLGDTSGDGIGDIALSAYYFGDGGIVYVLEGGGAPGTYEVDEAASATLVGTDGSDVRFEHGEHRRRRRRHASIPWWALYDATIRRVESGTVTAPPRSVRR